MTETESRPRNRALVASFLFTDLVGYSKGTASEQYAAKEALSEILRRNLAALGKDDYRIKDTGDGALIAFLVNPEHALYMALAIAHDFAHATNAAGLPSSNVRVRTGLHIGAVKEAIDLEARPNFVGDGINAAQRIMDFAKPGQITASRAYFEAVSWLDSAYAALFQHLGASNDKHGRPHELYAVTPNDEVLEKLRVDLGSGAQQPSAADKTPVASSSTQPDRPAPEAARPPSDAKPAKPAGERKWLVPAAVLAGVAVLAAIGYVVMTPSPSGVASRSAESKTAAPPTSTSPATQPVATTPAPALDAKAPITTAVSPQEANPSGTVARPGSDAATSMVPPTQEKSAALPRPSEPSRPGEVKPEAATAMRSAPDSNASAAAPARANSQTRPSPTSANVDTQRKAALSPAAPSAAGNSSGANASGASSMSAPPAMPAAATSASAPASARCRHILEKVQVGEPLSQDEKRELASTCR